MESLSPARRPAVRVYIEEALGVTVDDCESVFPLLNHVVMLLATTTATLEVLGHPNLFGRSRFAIDKSWQCLDDGGAALQ